MKRGKRKQFLLLAGARNQSRRAFVCFSSQEISNIINDWGGKKALHHLHNKGYK
jgi:hypothetical protein